MKNKRTAAHTATVLNLFPRYLQTLFVLCTIGKIQIDKRLIRYARILGQAFEVIHRITVDIYGYLLFQPVGIGILTWVKVLDIIFFSHLHSPAFLIDFSFVFGRFSCGYKTNNIVRVSVAMAYDTNF